MITTKQLFKTYNLKNWKQAKFQIFLSIFSVVIAAAILISLKLIIALNNYYITSNAKSVNEGDINIEVPNSIISNKQLNVLDKLTSEGKIQYATTYKIENNFTHDGIANTAEVKFIDPKYCYINKKVTDYVNKLGDHKVVINRAAADKFNLKKGDIISLKLKGLSNDYNKFKITDIVENTDVSNEDILGAIILSKSDLKLQTGKGIKIENLATNVNVIVNKNYNLNDIKSELYKSFGSGTNIVTYEEGIKSNKNIIDKEEKALDFIQILVTTITVISISFTTWLLILKRKKDYVLLSIYGMKSDILRNLILYETFIICAIGTIIGTFFSFAITGFVEKNILSEMDILSIIKVSILPILSTVLFIIIQMMISTILPIIISKKINPNVILRKETQKIFLKKEDYGTYTIEIFLLMTLSFSIYIGSLKNGVVCVSIILISIIIIYGLSKLGINLIIKLKNARNKFVLLALRNIERYKTRFSFCVTALIVTLVVCGFIVNLRNDLIPGIINKINYDIGYTLSVSTNFNKQNINNIEKILNREKYVKGYVKTIDVTGNFDSIRGKNFDNFIKGQKFEEGSKKQLKDFFYDNRSINIEAIDISKVILNYNTLQGRWFNKNDVNRKYIVLGDRFYHFGINVNDKIDLNIQGKNYKFTVIGICTESNFRDNSGIYIDINDIKNNNSIGDNNSKVKYLIKNDAVNEKKLYLNLTKSLNNSLVIDEKDKYNQVNKYIQKITYAFIYICIISIFSAVCLIGNVLMIINFDRLNEFIMFNILGAKSRDIRKITISEGIIIGLLSGILSSLICEVLSYNVLVGSFSVKYTANLEVDAIIIIAAVFLNILVSITVINSLKLEKYTEFLRAD